MAGNENLVEELRAVQRGTAHTRLQALCGKAAARIEGLEEALRFYAEPSIDGGKIARAALTGKEQGQ